MKKIIHALIILNSFILCARSMDDPPLLEPPCAAANFSLTVLAFMETYRHQTKGILVQKLHQEDENPSTFPYYSAPACNPIIPDDLYALSTKLNRQTQQDLNDYFAQTQPEDHFLIQISESVISNAHIELLNASSAQFVLLITTDKTSNLRRFINITKKLDPRIKIALSDRTERGIAAEDIRRLLKEPSCSKLYYLSLHRIRNDTAQEIAACAYLENLVGLSVERSYLSGKGVLAFGESSNLPSLQIFSVDLMALLNISELDFTERMAPFQHRLYRYDWVGRLI